MVRWWRGRDDVLRTAAAAMWRRNAAGGYHTIDAVPREHSGHRAASRERGFGRIPAVVTATGKGSPVSRKQLITFDKDQINSLLRDSAFFTSTIFDLQILAGVGSTVVLQSGNVVPVKVQKSVETGQVLNMVVAWVDESSELKVDVPVVFNGEDNCRGLKKGGYLHKIRTSLKYLCPSEHIPQKIEVNIANLDIGDKICLRDIKVHPSLKLLSRDNRTPICKIHPTEPAKPPHSEASSENTGT
ncbi:hypothetical protein KSP40_PGU009187 [Platanthera guangdongensis]|uniref:Ribosomal protein L25 beta domain-containing protein n=1 Tax=Platanthera guangdongensis TaxID=2320717 RepID=A0ABR2MC56_9ASPA